MRPLCFDLTNTHACCPFTRNQSSATGYFDFWEAAARRSASPALSLSGCSGAGGGTHLLRYYSDSVCTALPTYVSQLETVVF